VLAASSSGWQLQLVRLQNRMSTLQGELTAPAQVHAVDLISNRIKPHATHQAVKQQPKHFILSFPEIERPKIARNVVGI
jgi:hypothetical protein